MSVLSFSLYAVNSEYKTDVVIVGCGGAGITAAFFAAGTGLITDKEDVGGVRAKKANGEEIEIYASKVILVTSGFASNEEMLKKYIPEIANTYPLTASGTTGEGIVWGQKLGAE